MRWKALDWAIDIEVGSPKMKLILILLANKAGEQFSCYPSARTLMTEFFVTRSTVLNALKRLEREGLSRDSFSITIRVPSDPVVTSSTIQIRLTSRRAQNPDPLNRPEEPPSEPSPENLVQSMPEPWRLSAREATRLFADD
jgi:DNA-binding transcriptional MocR family regulator